MTAHHVFIRYAEPDKAIADAVCEQLETIHDVRCWIAPRDIPAGGSWATSSIAALDQSKIMVLVVSSDEHASMQSGGEVARAIRQGINVIPFRIDQPVSAGMLAGDRGDPDWLDPSSQWLAARISRLAENVKALIEGPAPAAVAPTPADLAHEPPEVSAVPVAAEAASSRLIPVAIGSVIVIALLTGVWWSLRDPLRPLATATFGVPPDAGQEAASTLPPSAETAASAPALEPTSPPSTPLTNLGPPGGAPPAPSSVARSGLPEAQDARPAGAVSGSTFTPEQPRATPTTLIANQTAAASPVGTATVKAAPDVTPAAQPDVATVSSRLDGLGEAQVASGLATSGTLLIEFINNFPDGSVEVEIDGERRWSQRLRLTKPAGTLELLRIQRVSEQIGSELRVPAGDHKITVTVLTAEGEVRDYGTTTLRVDAARSVTLRIRFSRFRNRLRLESAAG